MESYDEHRLDTYSERLYLFLLGQFSEVEQRKDSSVLRVGDFSYVFSTTEYLDKLVCMTLGRGFGTLMRQECRQHSFIPLF